MTPEEEKLEKAIRAAKAPLQEDVHTLTRALADEHRRVDVAVAARHRSETERNAALGTIKSLEKDKAGLQMQVTQLHTKLKGTQP